MLASCGSMSCTMHHKNRSSDRASLANLRGTVTGLGRERSIPFCEAWNDVVGLKLNPRWPMAEGEYITERLEQEQQHCKLAGSASASSSRKCLRDATCDSNCYLKSREIHRRHKLSVVANKRV